MPTRSHDQRLNELDDSVLQKLGVQFAKIGWRKIMDDCFTEFYGESFWEKRNKFYELPHSQNGSGYALAKDLSTYGEMTVQRVCDLLEKNGYGDAAFCLKPCEVPFFTKQPEALLVTAGQPATMACKAGGHPQPTYQWFCRNKSGGGGSWSKVEGAVDCFYKIRHASADLNNTEFCCRAKNKEGNTFSVAALLQVDQRKEDLMVGEGSLRFGNMPANETQLVRRIGDIAEFKCVVNGPGYLQYQWLHENQVLRGQSRPYLYIQSICAEDEGTYYCRVGNSRHSAISPPFKLRLNAKVPRVLSMKPEKTRHIVRKGYPLDLSVTVDNPGAMAFTWLRRHQDYQTPVVCGNSCRLHIANASKDDEGFYSCRVANQSSQVPDSECETMSACSREIEVLITHDGAEPMRQTSLVTEESSFNGSYASTPSVVSGSYQEDKHSFFPSRVSSIEQTSSEADTIPEIHVQPRSQSVMPGDRCTLTCMAHGHPPPNFIWFCNGREIKSTAGTLTIENFTITDEGTYSCEVFNRVAMVKSDSAFLTIGKVDQPVITEQPQNCVVGKNGEVTLTCSANCGGKRVYYQWYNSNGEIAREDREQLVVRAAKIDSSSGSDFFWCLVRNPLGYCVHSDMAKVTLVAEGTASSRGLCSQDSDEGKPPTTARGSLVAEHKEAAAVKKINVDKVEGKSKTEPHETQQEAGDRVQEIVRNEAPYCTRPDGSKCYMATAKVALLIANTHYTHEKNLTLELTEYDVSLIAERLRELQFQVLTFMDLTKKDMETAVNLFKEIVARAEGAYSFFFFAGHGYEVYNEVLLVPTDGDPDRIVETSVRIKHVQQQLMSCPSRLHTFIMDCCRLNKRNALPPEPITLPPLTNTITQFSCCSDTPALDVHGKNNSVYVEFLDKGLAEFGHEPVMTTLARVQDMQQRNSRVSSKSKIYQRPVLQVCLSKQLSLGDPVVIFPGAEGASSVTDIVEILNATPKPTRVTFESPLIHLVVKFASYMTNCLLVYTVLETLDEVDVELSQDISKFGQCCVKPASNQQVAWLRKQFKGERIVCNEGNKAVLFIPGLHCLCDREVETAKCKECVIKVKVTHKATGWKGSEVKTIEPSDNMKKGFAKYGATALIEKIRRGELSK